MTPTLTPEGVVSSFRLLPAVHAPNMNGCPFAKCSSVSFNKGLGVLSVDDISVAAVRLLVRMQAPQEDETVGIPDPQNVGFRVCRRVKCCLAPDDDQSIYELKNSRASSRGAVAVDGTRRQLLPDHSERPRSGQRFQCTGIPRSKKCRPCPLREAHVIPYTAQDQCASEPWNYGYPYKEA